MVRGVGQRDLNQEAGYAWVWRAAMAERLLIEYQRCVNWCGVGRGGEQLGLRD